MESYKRKAVAKSLEIRSKRLKFFKSCLTFAYWFVPISLICYCIFLLYKNELIHLPLSNQNQQVTSDDIIIEDGTIEPMQEDVINVGNETLDEIQDDTEYLFEEIVSQEYSNGEESLVDEIEPMDELFQENSGEGNEKEEIPENDQLENKKYKDKIIYLTFDDGPSKNTERILDILKEYDVKATFFVIGKEDDYSKEMYRRIVEEGHAIGIHSYSHNYKVVYKSLEDFEKDFTKLRDLVYDTTGYLPNIYRFPGGSATLAGSNLYHQIADFLVENQVEYYDWNILNRDATGERYTEEELIWNVLSGVDRFDHGIVLMHDSNGKKLTVDSLDDLLEILIENGASIRPIDSSVKPIQQVKKKN